jgi:hypothetical protein
MRGETNTSQGWRGAALIGLTVNHLVLWPLPNVSGILRYTYESLGWFTFASLYFGIAGYQWGKTAAGLGSADFWRWNAKRALRLYLWFAAVASITLLGIQTEIFRPAPWQRHLQWTGVESLILCLLGLKIPWLTDVLWLHAWLGLFSSLLWECPWLKGRTTAIALLSCAVWAVGNFLIPKWGFALAEAPSWHSWTAWQLAFIFAALFAQGDFQKFKEKLDGKRVKLLIAILLLSFFFAKHLLPESLVHGWAQANVFAPLFALNSFLVLLFGKSLALHFPRMLMNLGTTSLHVYAFHTVSIYCLGTLLESESISQATSFVLIFANVFLLMIVSRFSLAWRRSCRCSSHSVATSSYLPPAKKNSRRLRF